MTFTMVTSALIRLQSRCELDLSFGIIVQSSYCKRVGVYLRLKFLNRKCKTSNNIGASNQSLFIFEVYR